MDRRAWIKNRQGEKFTFETGMIDDIKTNRECGVDQMTMPMGAEMSNQGTDLDGVGKNISITGILFDTKNSVTDSNNIRSKEIMKYWLDALADGIQLPVEFFSHLNEYSVQGGGTTTTFHDDISGEDVVIQASFVKTKVYVMGFTYDEVQAGVEQIPFTLTLWVASF